MNLPTVTLLCLDCKNIQRALKSLSISLKQINPGQAKLLTSLTVKPEEHSPLIEIQTIPPIKTIQEYSRFMIKELYNYVETPFALCTQWDAFVLNANAWTEEFLQYDYCGAPWWFQDHKNVGNGGFSLRSKKFLKVCSELPIKNFHPEDLVLCRTYRNLIESKGIRIAPEQLAARFSLEGNAKYNRKWNGSTFGFHDLEMTDISNWSGYNEFMQST